MYNNYNTNANFSPPKKRHHHSFDSDMPPLGLPRKKFISEESFAKDMAAMSLDNQNPASKEQNSNVYSVQDELEDEESNVDNVYMALDTNGKPLIDIDGNGLPIELRPGESKPRIPQFVLENPELLDPRDKLAYQHMMKSLLNKQQKHVEIEVLNNPSSHYTPTSMDID